MIKVRKISEIKIGDKANIVGISKHYSSYGSDMERFIGDQITILDTNNMGHILSSNRWWFPRASYDFCGDSESIKLNELKPNLSVKIGKELDNMYLTGIAEYVRRSKGLDFSDVIHLEDGNENMYYNKIFRVINSEELYLSPCCQGIYVGLNVDGKILYLPSYVLFKIEPNYKPKYIKRSV